MIVPDADHAAASRHSSRTVVPSPVGVDRAGAADRGDAREDRRADAEPVVAARRRGRSPRRCRAPRCARAPGRRCRRPRPRAPTPPACCAAFAIGLRRGQRRAPARRGRASAAWSARSSRSTCDLDAELERGALDVVGDARGIPRLVAALLRVLLGVGQPGERLARHRRRRACARAACAARSAAISAASTLSCMSAATAMRSCSAASAAAAARVRLDRARARLVDVRRDRAEHPAERRRAARRGSARTTRRGRPDTRNRASKPPWMSRTTPNRSGTKRRPDDLQRQREREHAGDRRDVDQVPDPRLSRRRSARCPRVGDRPQDERERGRRARRSPRVTRTAATDEAGEDHRRQRHERQRS